jgi:hypothetical protein
VEKGESVLKQFIPIISYSIHSIYDYLCNVHQKDFVLRETQLRRWYVRGWGQGGEMTQAFYAHMNDKTINFF